MYCRKRGTCFFFHHYPDIRYGMKFSQNNIEREDPSLGFSTIKV